MGDNINGIPFSSDDEGTDFITRAKELVLKTTNQEGIIALRSDEIYVVWFAFVRRNWKALISTSIPDGRIYEVSWTPDGPTIVDVYIKTHNIVVDES